MEAKDTVMNREQIRVAWLKSNNIPVGLLHETTVEEQVIIEAQAEISFKAGRDSLIKILDQTSNEALKMVAEARLAGIKEAVEWMITNQDKEGFKGLFYFSIELKRWQSKLKEWGINEKVIHKKNLR